MSNKENSDKLICKECRQCLPESFVFCGFCGKPLNAGNHPQSLA